MDADLWAARLSAAKRQHALQSQHHQWDHFSVEDFEVDDDIRLEFACPYCYEDFEISALCAHLEEEHMFEPKGVVCPVCAVKVPKDMIGHMTLQHSHLFKIPRRRRFRRSLVPAGSTFCREGHLQALLAGGSLSNAAESFLSALAYGLPISDSEDVSKQTQHIEETLPNVVASPIKQNKSSSEVFLSMEEREQRANFIQELLLSTMNHQSQEPRM